MVQKTLIALCIFCLAGLSGPTAVAEAQGGYPIAQSPSPTPTDSPNIGNTTGPNISPGERLSGVIGVQKAELDGNLKNRTFGIRINSAGNDHAKAQIIAAEFRAIDRRLNDLENQQAALKQARSNGSISKTAYRVRTTELVAKMQTVEARAYITGDQAATLPAKPLKDVGMNMTSIRTLTEHAGNLPGPKIAAIAQATAGERVDRSGKSSGPPDEGRRKDEPRSREGIDPLNATPNTENSASGNESKMTDNQPGDDQSSPDGGQENQSGKSTPDEEPGSDTADDQPDTEEPQTEDSDKDNKHKNTDKTDQSNENKRSH
jgi:hypothetical protein